MSSDKKRTRTVSSSNNTRVVLSSLCKSLTTHMTIQEKQVYDEAYRNAIVQKTSTHDLTLGCIPVLILISSIESGLNAVQSHLDKIQSQPVGKYWNPTIASLLRALGQMANSGLPESVSRIKPKPEKGKSAKVVTKAVPVGPVPLKESVSATPAGEGKSRKSKPSYSSIVKIPSIDASLDSEPRSPAYQPDEPCPSESQTGGVDTCTIRRELSNFLESSKGPYVKHLSSACTRTECIFCRDAVRHVAVSRCVGHKLCHASGWYPHIGQMLWQILKRRHNKGLSFVPRSEPCKLKDGELEPLMHGLTLNSIRDSPKRKAESSDLVDVKVARVGVPPPSEPESETDRSPWADEVESEWEEGS